MSTARLKKRVSQVRALLTEIKDTQEPRLTWEGPKPTKHQLLYRISLSGDESNVLIWGIASTPSDQNANKNAALVLRRGLREKFNIVVSRQNTMSIGFQLLTSVSEDEEEEKEWDRLIEKAFGSVNEKATVSSQPTARKRPSTPRRPKSSK